MPGQKACRATNVMRHGLWPMLTGARAWRRIPPLRAWRSCRLRRSAAARPGRAIAGSPTARFGPARTAHRSGIRARAAKRNSAMTSRAMPTSGRRTSPTTRRPLGFNSFLISANAASSSSAVMYCATEFITARSTDCSGMMPQIVQRAHPDLGVRGKAGDQPAAHPGRRLGQIQQAASVGDLRRRHRLAAGIVQHHGVLRRDVADDVLGDQLEMQVAVQLAGINRMRGIVIIDPVVHCGRDPAKPGFRCGNRVLTWCVRQSGEPCPSPSCPVQRKSTGRCIVSKAKSDKVSPDLDTPTDLPHSGGGQDLGAAQRAGGRRLRALPQDQEFPLARLGPAFPRLSPDAGRAVGRDFRHHRPAGRAGAQAGGHHAALDRPDRQAADHQGQ